MFREAQRKVIEEYQKGMMGIAAVPGSGKTFTLSHLAARLVGELMQKSGSPEQEVLIVTFSNSAVNGFKKRIADILQHERKLLPYVGYRVRTLHALAHDIVRERPALVGLADDFQIIDDRTAANIRDDIVRTHLPAWESMMEYYLDSMLSEGQQKNVLGYHFPNTMVMVAERYISHAKDNQLTPEMLQAELEGISYDFRLAEFCNVVYTDYQRSLAFRGAVDFSDLVHLALQALQMDAQFLRRLRERWVYILEDEAQDSSSLQEQMLKLLSGEKNWVRVGDPNQAINTTFTTANPVFLSEFLGGKKVTARQLPNSGRSSRKIMSLANELVRWSTELHPVDELQDAFYPQNILPTEADDAQQNPPDEISTIYIHYNPEQPISPEKELELVARSLKSYVAEHKDKTVAVLVPENNRGFKLTELLRNEEIPYEELLRSSTETRVVAAYLYAILQYLASPYESRLLAKVYSDVWWKLTLAYDESRSIDTPYQAILKYRQLENLIYPVEDNFPSVILNIDDEDTVLRHNLDEFIMVIRRWLAALTLPIDQLILTISQDLFEEAADIALAYRIAALMRGFAEEYPAWTLSEFAEELRVITDNQRRFIGFDDATTGFEPTPGKVTVSTMHAAKGLEWDRVYLMAVNTYSFPSLVTSDSYAGQKWFVRDNLNLEMCALAQLYALKGKRPGSYSEHEASRQGFTDNAKERLRLLYVGITRAREDLIVIWNTGRGFDNTVRNNLALPMVYLKKWLDELETS